MERWSGLMQDPVFGKIEWRSDAWQGSLKVPYFNGFGRSIDDGDVGGRERGAEEGRTTSGNVSLPVEIDTNEVPKRPAKLQRDAFAQIIRRGDKAWVWVMDALTAEYQRQRPKRLRYWKMLYGRRGINKSLPPVESSDGLKPLTLPVGLYVRALASSEATGDVDLMVCLAWFSESAFVTIQEGRATEVRGMPSWHTRNWERTDHAVFGTLRRPSRRAPSWLGTVGAGPFADWAAISVDRAEWDEDTPKRRAPASNLDWYVARGDCFLRAYVNGNKPPSTPQAAAFEAFRNNQEEEGIAIKEALFDYYHSNLNASRKSYKGPHVDRAVPKIEKADDLRDLTELSLINVFPGKCEHPLAIGLIFRGAWTGQAEVGIRWREGQVEEVGKGEIATPPSP
jgi:hypothetical protein